MENLSGDLTLRTRSFDPKHPGTRTLVFAEPQGGMLLIDILNLCAEELVGPRPQLPGIDRDFVLNYLLSANGRGRLLNRERLGVPVATQFDPGDEGGGEFARCTNPQAAPVAPADRDRLVQLAKHV